MNEASEQMTEWLGAVDATRAETSLRWLVGHLETDLFDHSPQLREVIESDRDVHLKLLHKIRRRVRQSSAQHGR